MAASLLVERREEKSLILCCLPSRATNLAIVNSGYLLPPLEKLDFGGFYELVVFYLIGSRILELERMFICTCPSPVTTG